MLEVHLGNWQEKSEMEGNALRDKLNLVNGAIRFQFHGGFNPNETAEVFPSQFSPVSISTVFYQAHGAAEFSLTNRIPGINCFATTATSPFYFNPEYINYPNPNFVILGLNPAYLSTEKIYDKYTLLSFLGTAIVEKLNSPAALMQSAQLQNNMTMPLLPHSEIFAQALSEYLPQTDLKNRPVVTDNRGVFWMMNRSEQVRNIANGFVTLNSLAMALVLSRNTLGDLVLKNERSVFDHYIAQVWKDTHAKNPFLQERFEPHMEWRELANDISTQQIGIEYWRNPV